MNQQQYQQQMPRKSGIPAWLIALIVVPIVGIFGIIIVGILAAVAAPKFADNVTKARCSEVPRTFKYISEGLAEYEAESGTYITLKNSGEINQKLSLRSPIQSQFFNYSVKAESGGYTITAEVVKPLGRIQIGDKVWQKKDGSKGTSSPKFEEYLQAFLKYRN